MMGGGGGGGGDDVESRRWRAEIAAMTTRTYILSRRVTIEGPDNEGSGLISARSATT
jgi:hypothetical protein